VLENTPGRGLGCHRLALPRGDGLLPRLSRSVSQQVAIGQEDQVRDVDDLKDLKRQYMELVRRYGQEVTEFNAFKYSLLDMNRRHRLEAARMYASIISKVERKVGRKTSESRGRNDEMQRTRHAQDGASPLISGLGRPELLQNLSKEPSNAFPRLRATAGSNADLAAHRLPCALGEIGREVPVRWPDKPGMLAACSGPMIVLAGRTSQ
jgi:hypothetical protein